MDEINRNDEIRMTGIARTPMKLADPMARSQRAKYCVACR